MKTIEHVDAWETTVEIVSHSSTPRVNLIPKDIKNRGNLFAWSIYDVVLTYKIYKL